VNDNDNDNNNNNNNDQTISAVIIIGKGEMKGCQGTFTRAKLKLHQELECPSRLVACKWLDNGCHQQIIQSSFDQHINECKNMPFLTKRLIHFNMHTSTYISIDLVYR
jgi:hypothetical protein